MNKRLLFGIFLLAASSASADVITDAQELSTQYSGSFSVDPNNSAHLKFETMMPNQDVELRLFTLTTDTTAFGVMASAGGTRFDQKPCENKTCSSSSLQAATFSKFKVFINGCNVSQALIDACNTADCWAINPTTNRSNSNAWLGSEFSFAKSVAINSLDTSGCAMGTFSGLDNDDTYSIEFQEGDTGVVAGKVGYELVIKNRTPDSRRIHVRNLGRKGI